MPISPVKSAVTASARSNPYTAGEALERGWVAQVDGNGVVTKASNAAPENANARGLVLQDVDAGQPVQLSLEGATVELGAVSLELKDNVYLGVDGAMIRPAEFTGGEQVTHIGVAISATAIKQAIVPTGGTA